MGRKLGAQPGCDMQPLWTVDAGHYADRCICKEEQYLLLFDIDSVRASASFIVLRGYPPACNIGAASCPGTVEFSLIFPLAPAHLCQFNLLPLDSRALAKRHNTSSFIYAALFSCLKSKKLDYQSLHSRQKRRANQPISRRILPIKIGMFWCKANALW